MFTSPPLTCNYTMAEDENRVLDLRVYKQVEEFKQEEMVAGQLTPPRDGSPVGIAPTLAITQKVLAAAQAQHTRPFKAYPKDPLSLSSAQDESYIKFREEMLCQVKGAKRKRPVSPQRSPDSRNDERDAAYWERRRKNNEAAKRSRDARRAKEDEIAIRAAFLEQENLKLKYQVAVLTEETAHLRCLMYKGSEHHIGRYPPAPPMV